MKLYDPIMMVIASVIILAVFYIVPFQLDNELGFIGFYTGVLTIALFVLEGGPGPLVQAITVIAVIALLIYMVHEWYMTTPIFL